MSRGYTICAWCKQPIDLYGDVCVEAPDGGDVHEGCLEEMEGDDGA